jgi:integrase
MNSSVNLTKRVKTPAGLRYYPAFVAANGRVKPDFVLVDGKEERHPEGAYYIEWREGVKRIRQSVGKDASTAIVQKFRQEQILRSRAAGLKLVEEKKDGALLGSVVDTYLEEIRLTRKPKTHAAYKIALEYFLESCNKNRLSEIERNDLIRFAAFLRDVKKQSPRSCSNKFENVMSFLKAQKIRGIDLGITKHDWPKFTEDEPEIYERQDLDKFFAACDPDERLWFEFFLMTGMREQEVMHCTWEEINFNRCTITVRYKAEYGFSPKAYKGREIPIPDALLRKLKQMKKERNDESCPLLFPTGGCNPKLDFLDVCKAVAKKARLNPNDFRLHKFRATFATWALWHGVDLRTVQSWMGHTDLESTMRYLKPNRGQTVREKVNAIFD